MRNKLNTIPMISTQVNPGQFRQCLPIALDNVNGIPILYIVKNDKTFFQLCANIPIKRILPKNAAALVRALLVPKVVLACAIGRGAGGV